MARAKKREEVFTLGPELKADTQDNDRAAFAERLQRVARRMSERNAPAEELLLEPEVEVHDEFPEALKGFTFHQEQHGKGMLIGVIAAPLAFVACVIVAVSTLGPMGEASPENQIATDQHQTAHVATSETVLVVPPLDANTALEPLLATASVDDQPQAFRAEHDWTITIPAGSVIEKVDLEKGQLAIHLEADDRRRVVAYDTIYGRVIRREDASVAPSSIIGPAGQRVEEFIALVDERGVLPPSLKVRP